MSSLKEDASLILIPSLYKDGRLDTIKPLGNETIHPDATGNHDGTDGATPADGNFTFSRGSNLAATRRNSSGLIEKGRENLLLQSNQFDTTWTTTNTSVTSGQTGYDDSSDAWLLDITAGTNSQKVQQSISASGVNCFSVYAKEGTLSSMALEVNSALVYYNLSTGVIGSSSGSALVDKEIVSVGNGWYRCSLVSKSAITVVRIYPDAGDYDTFQSSGSIYIQDAQLEKGLVATDYIKTGSSTAQAGILEDMPRINYDANGENGALLLEPSRSNLITYGNYFNGWSKTSASVTTNAATSPDGLQNASKLVEASGSSFHFIGSTPTIASGAATFSFYAKAAERTSVSAFLTQSGNNGANFDLSAETATAQGTGNTASIESVGNGWYRCIVSNSGGAQIASQVRIGIKNGALDSYVGDGTSGVYIYGAQCEQASYHSSLIPTHGAAVTRGADSCRGLFNGDNIFDSNWTAMVELVAPNQGTAGTSAGWGVRTTEGSTSNSNWSFVLVHRTNGLNLKTFGTATDHNLTYNFGDNLKLIVRSDGTYFYNGSKYTLTGLSSNEPVEVGFGRAGQTNFSAGESADIKQTLLFQTLLSDSECIALTQ